jgi:hypothetical protein
MLSWAHSTDKFLASWFMAALVIAYSTPLRMLMGPPATELLNRTTPEPAALSSGWAIWVSTKADCRLVLNTN